MLRAAASTLTRSVRRASAVRWPAPVRCLSSFRTADLKELRAVSGAPMMECKKALGETGGDVQAAMDWLRQHGAAKASKKVSGRDASEGLVSVLVSDDNRSAAVVRVQSETDFASRSAPFLQLVQHVANATLAYDADADADVALTQNETKLAVHDGRSVQTALEEAIVAIRENLGLSTALRWTTGNDHNAVLVGYVHGRVDGSQAGSSAALVELTSTVADRDTQLQIGKKLAMHVVAAKPDYLDAESVPNDILDKERDILKTQIADSNKPPNVVDKIVAGRMRKFYEGVCLMEQEHLIEDGNPKVREALEEANIQLKRFTLLSI